MIVFLLGWSDDGAVASTTAQAALRAYVKTTPFFRAENEGGWAAKSGRFCATWVTHDADQVGGIRYVTGDPSRFALFAGRPIRWIGQHDADGRAPLDPRYYLGDPDQWSDTLDGRFFASRYDDATRSMTICTDAMGAYPVFRARRGANLWVSNAPSMLCGLLDKADIELDVVAEHVACGWSLAGKPWWSGVERVERGTVATYTEGASPRARELLPTSEVASMYGRRMPIPVATRMIVASLRALSDWPGRPSLVPVTGGKDSRLLLPAAIAAGLRCEFVTGGTAERPDVVVAQQLCAQVGVPHRLVPSYPYWSVEKDHLPVARLYAEIMGGMVTTGDAMGYPIQSIPGPLVLWHSGQGGEIARGFYGVGRGSVGRVATELFQKVTGLHSGRRGLLTDDAVECVRSRIRAWVDEIVHAGGRCLDVPDLFYALNRMPNWSAPSHGCVELVRDTTSPLWSRQLLPYMVGASAAQRSREHFHYRVLEDLDASLLGVPFAGDEWPTWRSELIKRARRAASGARRALMQSIGSFRLAPTSGLAKAASDGTVSPFARVVATTREHVCSQHHHAAWSILDRARVDELFCTPVVSLTAAQQLSVWRLLDVFSTPLATIDAS